MQYRRLGKTGVQVSEIGFGGEWLERHTEEESRELFRCAEAGGINIVDCWMCDPVVRRKLGAGLAGHREKWYVQGHIGSVWHNGQYLRTREVSLAKEGFEELLRLLDTDYIDFGMIHFVDEIKDWQAIQDSEYLRYIFSLKEQGRIRHIGLGTHNPEIAKRAALSGYVEMILFSVNPAFDLLPPTENIDEYFAQEYDQRFGGGIAPERAELYSICEREDVGITVMKGYAGGRLLDARHSPFGVALTPAQCLHYCLTRPAVASVLCGYDTPEQIAQALSYETADDAQKDYASVLASAPRHAYFGQCTYCGHCKPCPAFIDIASVNKYYDLASMQKELPSTIREHYAVLEHHAGECVGCRGCETRCPFGVKIADRMRKAAELFGS